MTTTHFITAIRYLAKEHNSSADVDDLARWRVKVKDPHYKPPEYFSYKFKVDVYNFVRKHFPPGHPGFKKAFEIYEQVRNTKFEDVYE